MITPLYYTTERLPHGWIAATCSEQGITQLSPPCDSQELALSSLRILPATSSHRANKFVPFIQELTLFLDGKIAQFSSPIDLPTGPLFFREVWDTCRTIPYGETRTYSWLASTAGSPNASRAVGQAMARNPLPILVPCHRVLRSSGHLGGYAWGPDVKAWLLAIEKTNRGHLSHYAS